MSNSARAILKIGTILVLVAVFAVYGLYRSRNFIAGPKIIIESPGDGIAVNDSYMEIRGIAKNMAHLYFNGRQIFTDEQGKFKESLLLTKGYNIIEIVGRDKFGREIKAKRELVLK